MTLDTKTGYWMFICNPKVWSIDEFLSNKHLPTDTYKITDYHKDDIHIGHLGVIRVGVDKRTKAERKGKSKLDAGVYAIVQILSEPYKRGSQHDFEFWTDKKIDRSNDWVVDIKYLVNLINNPILIDGLRGNKAIDSDLINNRQGSTWAIDKQTFEIIQDMSEYPLDETVYVPTVNSSAKLQEIEQKYSNATPQVKTKVSQYIERGSIGEQIKALNNYQCQVCQATGQYPFSFKKTNGTHYIESHHVYPVSSRKEGVLGASNIISVCANHHRQIHYGNVKLLDDSEDFFVFEMDNERVEIQKILLEK